VWENCFILLLSRCIKEFMLERSHMYVSNAGKVSYIPMPLKYTDELTLGRIPMAVSGMGRLHLF
jgi:hypothetical protein